MTRSPNKNSSGDRGGEDSCNYLYNDQSVEMDPCEEVIEIVHELYQAGLISRTGGNISIRSENHQAIWITPTQTHKGKLNKDYLVLIDIEGNKLDHTITQPSSEKFVHTQIYKAYPEVNAVIHAHAPYSTALGLCGLPFLDITIESAMIQEIPRIPFIMPGTLELARAVVAAMKVHQNSEEPAGWNPAVLMLNHGIVISATDLRRAADLLENIERTSRLIILCYSMGIKPALIPKKEIKAIHLSGKWTA